jgi:hypothetical protein
MKEKRINVIFTVAWQKTDFLLRPLLDPPLLSPPSRSELGLQIINI